MQKTMSDIIWGLFLLLSFAFWLVIAGNLVGIARPDILVPFTSCIFIYNMTRFTGWMVNRMIKK